MLLRLALAFFILGFGLAPSASAQDALQRLERPDGSGIEFRLAGPATRGRGPMLLMLQGSGCESVDRNPRLPWMAARLAPRHAVVTIEKYGVARGADGEGCSAEYWRRNTLQQRVADALQVIAAVRHQGWWNGELVLFGGSEGGAVAAMLAPLVPETRAVVIWSSGIGLPIGDMIRSALPPAMAEEAVRVFAEARANPTGERQWAGASYRWWADSVDLVPARGLLDMAAPVLIIHGTRDASAPVASARAARDLLAGGRTPVVYREYEGYDHFMIDASGVDRRAEVLAAAADWLRRLPRRRR